MSLIRINRRLFIKVINSQCNYMSTNQLNEEYTAVAHYPEILDVSYEKIQERKKEAKYEEIKNVKTIEEKQIKLNMPKYYGYKSYIFKEDSIPYNNLNLTQHITRTHLIKNKNLPEYYNDINVDKTVELIKPQIEEAVLLEFEGYKRAHDIKKSNLSKHDLENIISSSVAKQINRVILNSLSQDYEHLLESEIDYDPRIESFWFAGGMDPPENIKKYRKAVEWRKRTENEPTDRAIQYIGAPLITLRNVHPLKPIIPYLDASNQDFNVPYFKYDPRVVGTVTQHQHGANIPGYWPGEAQQFGLISIHKRGHMMLRDYNDIEDNKDAVYRQGILSSFAWLNAQANFLGFTTFNDITYPLVNQAIITNGQIWSLFVYQLNTVLMHGKNITENPKRNICWATEELKLFEEFKENKLISLNEDVLKMIVKFYVNSPVERLGVNMRPYLSQEEKNVADYQNDDKRAWLEREYKYLVSNRPRFKLEYELYHWEKIYKVDEKTRMMEKRRRPFELYQKPSDRTLNDRQAFYVPKVLRPDLPKYKGRYAKEYFP